MFRNPYTPPAVECSEKPETQIAIVYPFNIVAFAFVAAMLWPWMLLVIAAFVVANWFGSELRPSFAAILLLATVGGVLSGLWVVTAVLVLYPLIFG